MARQRRVDRPSDAGLRRLVQPLYDGREATIMKPSSSERLAVAVSFCALDGDPYERDRTTGRYIHDPSDNPVYWGPTLRAVADPRSDLYGRISDWYYLCHPVKVDRPERAVARTAKDVAADMKLALRERLPVELRPRLHDRALLTERPPNDHADLWRCIRTELPVVRAAHPDAELVFVVSSGTSAMNSVLFLAGSVGVVEGPIRLVQVERGEGGRLRAHQPIVDVTLQLETVLRVARETVPTHAGADMVPGVAYDRAISPALRRALDEARHAARVPFPILLRGERGVGKSTLATFIRAWSPFRKKARDRQWPAVACGQFTDPERLRAELCGWVRGAFTGADRDHPGLLALAHEDTLFLDEIHDLSDANQRVLIRLIENGDYYRLGSDTPLRSRFRLITGTNRPDDELRKLLSPDFYDRIRDIEIEVPPLRDCAEDLPWMWEAAWTDAANRSDLKPDVLHGCHALIVEALRGNPLPGNWRDLRRLAVRLVVYVHAGGKATAKSVENLVNAFFRISPGVQPIITSEARGARLLPKRQAEQLRKLEENLGPDLGRLWRECEAGAAPRVALGHLLGDRHRAARAEKFIAELFPERWASATRAGAEPR